MYRLFTCDIIVTRKKKTWEISVIPVSKLTCMGNTQRGEKNKTNENKMQYSKASHYRARNKYLLNIQTSKGTHLRPRTERHLTWTTATEQKPMKSIVCLGSVSHFLWISVLHQLFLFYSFHIKKKKLSNQERNGERVMETKPYGCFSKTQVFDCSTFHRR